MFDTASQTISGVTVDNKGSNYVNPKVVITEGDGVDADFDIVVRNGQIFSLVVSKVGRGYTQAPKIQIIEGDVEAFANSNSIGVPQSVTFVKNGGAFHLDKTVASSFTSNYVVALKNYNGNFSKGELVVQKVNNVEVFRARVAEWRFGSRLLKLENTVGIIRENVAIESYNTTVSGIVHSIFVSTFDEEISSFYDNLGFYTSDRGRLGVSLSLIQI